ncbi:transposase [Deinococcus detaillensis]|nr:transposase [Deinococcus detaillensis]
MPLGDQLTLVEVLLPAEGDETGPYDVVVRAVETVLCPHCQGRHAVRHDPPITVLHLPFGDHPVRLTITEGRATCPDTGLLVMCELPDRQGRVTGALARYIVRRRGLEPQRGLAARLLLSPSAVQRLHDAARRRLSSPADQSPRTVPEPEVSRIERLGLDDIYIAKSRFLVAVDLDTGRILALRKVSSIIQGKADQVDLPGFMTDLPETKQVALDMNVEQFQAAKARWPSAIFVVDKRHVLQVVDRDVLTLAARVMLERWEDDAIGQAQALRQFGAAAYPYLSLRTLVLRRWRNLTPADLAFWALLKVEGGESATSPPQLLWRAYLFREALYELYDVTRPPSDFKRGLELWREDVRQWSQRVKDPSTGVSAPLGRILWALRQYWDACLAYATTKTTNADTELVNAQIRRNLRRGHRFVPESLVQLVNQTADARRAPPLQPPAPVIWKARPVSQVVALEASPQKWSAEITRADRNLPRQSPLLELTVPVWAWLHRPQDPRRRAGERWLHEIVKCLPAAERTAWQLCNSGQPEGIPDFTVSISQLERWRAVVHHRYVVTQLERLDPSEAQRQVTLMDLRVDDLVSRCPDLHRAVGDLYRRLATVESLVLSPEDEQIMIQVVTWHSLVSDLELRE